jgi:hypothetical protein
MNYRILGSKKISGLSTRVYRCLRFPHRHIYLTNSYTRKHALYINQSIRPGRRPTPVPILQNSGHSSIKANSRVINNPTPIGINQPPSSVPSIKPKRNSMPLPNFKTQELFSNIPEVEKSFPTPRAALRNSNLP